MNFNLNFMPFTKINSKRVMGQKLNSIVIKILEEKIENLYDFKQTVYRYDTQKTIL